MRHYYSFSIPKIQKFAFVKVDINNAKGNEVLVHSAQEPPPGWGDIDFDFKMHLNVPALQEVDDIVVVIPVPLSDREEGGWLDLVTYISDDRFAAEMLPAESVRKHSDEKLLLIFGRSINPIVMQDGAAVVWTTELNEV